AHATSRVVEDVVLTQRGDGRLSIHHPVADQFQLDLDTRCIEGQLFDFPVQVTHFCRVLYPFEATEQDRQGIEVIGVDLEIDGFQTEVVEFCFHVAACNRNKGVRTS